MQREVQSQVSNESHLKIIKALWTKNNQITPERVRNNFQLLHEDNPIYAVEAVEAVLASFRPDRIRPTAARRAAMELAHNQETESLPLGTPNSQAVPNSVLTVFVLHNEFGRAKLRVPYGCTITQFKELARAAFELDSDSRLRVSLTFEDSTRPLCIPDNEALTDALEQFGSDCMFLVRPANSDSHASDCGTPVSRPNFPPLSPALEPSRMAATTQWQQSRKVADSIKTRVSDTLKPDGGYFGSAEVVTSIRDTLRLMRGCHLLRDAWADLCAEHQAFALDIDVRKLLEWFINAIMHHFHPSLLELWQQEASDPTLQKQRQAASFPTFEAFAIQVYLTVRPGITGFPVHVLPEMLAELETRLPTFPTRRLVCSELRHILATTQFLQVHLCPGAGMVDQPVQQFLERVLSAGVREQLCIILKENHSADLPPHLQHHLDFAPLQAYAIDSILARWTALDSLQTRPISADWAAPSRLTGTFQGPRRSTSHAQADSARSTYSTDVHEKTAGVPPWSTETFNITLAGKPVTLWKHLGSWPTQSERDQELSKFVEAMYKFDGDCHICHQRGHRARGCPSHIRLDPGTGIDLNPKSFFYNLKPPAVALAAARPTGSSVPDPSMRGWSRVRKTIDARGVDSSRAALVAQVQSLEDTRLRLEAELELFKRERQRDQMRQEADGSQDGRELRSPASGNGRAGAV